MARTPDRRTGRLEEEEILFDDRSSDGDPTDTRALRYTDGAFRAKDAQGVFNLRLNVGADIDFLLCNEPPEPTTDYAITRSGGSVTLEAWTRNGGNLLKDITYIRSSGVVTQEDRKVYDTDGTTVLGHLRVTYTRSSGQVVSGTYTRMV